MDVAAYTLVFTLVACACAARAWSDPRQRLAWSIAVVGVVVWGAADVVYRIVESDPTAPYPPATQALLVVAFPVGAASVILLARRRVRTLRLDLLLDGLISGFAVAAVAAAFLFPALERAHDRGLGSDAPPGFYMLASLALLVFVVVTLALTGWRPGRGWTLMCASIAVNFAGQLAL